MKLQPPITSSLFGSNILLSTLFSNTLIQCLQNCNVRLDRMDDLSYSSMETEIYTYISNRFPFTVLYETSNYSNWCRVQFPILVTATLL
jgi:hypothetical protein